MVSNESINCQTCGAEHYRNELKTIKIAGFEAPMTICESCISKTAEDSFKDAAQIISDIVSIAKSSKDPELRLESIKSLLGE